MIALTELPDVQEQIVDAATVGQLFFDLEHAARVFTVLYGTETGNASALGAARDAILSGSTRRVQVRYTYLGEEWWDTLMAVPEGLRIIRIRQRG